VKRALSHLNLYHMLWCILGLQFCTQCLKMSRYTDQDRHMCPGKEAAKWMK